MRTVHVREILLVFLLQTRNSALYFLKKQLTYWMIRLEAFQTTRLVTLGASYIHSFGSGLGHEATFFR